MTIICHCSVYRSWNKPDFALGDHVRQRHFVVLYPPGHACAAAVYVVSLTTVDITFMLGFLITLVAPMDYWFCVSLCFCVLA